MTRPTRTSRGLAAVLPAVGGILLLAGGSAAADFKWVQWPDITDKGIDIRIDSPNAQSVRVLADDFQCTSPSRITGFCVWTSWRDDRVGVIRRIRLTIRPDDPAGPGGASSTNAHSMPGPEVLWTRDFLPGEFQQTLILCGPCPRGMVVGPIPG